MMLRIQGRQAAARTMDASYNSPRRFVMKWETPQAIELRFGMEITMYMANR